MVAHKTINDLLVGLFRQIMAQESECLITDEFSDITVNDMHIIESIGIDVPKNMSMISGELKITISTLTIAINSLTKKGYVEKIPSEVDRRKVYLILTDKGVRAYERHAQFHENMTEEVLSVLNEEETAVFIRGMQGVMDYFQMKNE